MSPLCLNSLALVKKLCVFELGDFELGGWGMVGCCQMLGGIADGGDDIDGGGECMK